MFAEFGVLNYLTYLVGAIFIILVPGPNTFFVLKTGIAHGVKKGYLAAAGVFIGDAVLMFLAFAGVATLIKTTPVLFTSSATSGRSTCCGWVAKCFMRC